MKIHFDENGNFTKVKSGGKNYSVEEWNNKNEKKSIEEVTKLL